MFNIPLFNFSIPFLNSPETSQSKLWSQTGHPIDPNDPDLLRNYGFNLSKEAKEFSFYSSASSIPNEIGPIRKLVVAVKRKLMTDDTATSLLQIIAWRYLRGSDEMRRSATFKVYKYLHQEKPSLLMVIGNTALRLPLHRSSIYTSFFRASFQFSQGARIIYLAVSKELKANEPSALDFNKRMVTSSDISLESESLLKMDSPLAFKEGYALLLEEHFSRPSWTTYEHMVHHFPRLSKVENNRESLLKIIASMVRSASEFLLKDTYKDRLKRDLLLCLLRCDFPPLRESFNQIFTLEDRKNTCLQMALKETYHTSAIKVIRACIDKSLIDSGTELWIRYAVENPKELYFLWELGKKEFPDFCSFDTLAQHLIVRSNKKVKEAVRDYLLIVKHLHLPVKLWRDYIKCLGLEDSILAWNKTEQLKVRRQLLEDKIFIHYLTERLLSSSVLAHHELAAQLKLEHKEQMKALYAHRSRHWSKKNDH